MINNYRVGNILKLSGSIGVYHFCDALAEIVKVRHYKEENAYYSTNKPFTTELMIIYNGDHKAVLNDSNNILSTIVSAVFEDKETAELLYGG